MGQACARWRIDEGAAEWRCARAERSSAAWFWRALADARLQSHPFTGGKYFDPFGLSRGDAAKYAEYKQKEIKVMTPAPVVGVVPTATP
jgi:hypothetical protein